jgi:hypothetical protein
MVRMVRILGVAALVGTGLMLASIKWPLRPLHLGVTQDRDAKRLLEGPGAVTRFNSYQDHNEVSDNQDKTPPLVKQAQTLEEILNPRVPVAQAPVPGSSPRGPALPKPPTSTAKFDLVGISYSPSDPASSFAYIRLPDNTYQWVCQGSEVGHLIVKQIKGNSIVCSDGQRMSEMSVEPTIDTANILETGAGLSVANRITEGAVPSSARLTGQDQASLDELVQRIKLKLQNEDKSGQADSNATSAEKAAAAGKLITEYKSSLVGTEEAQNLEKLGEKLNGAKDNQIEEKRRELLRRMSQPRPPRQ